MSVCCADGSVDTEENAGTRASAEESEASPPKFRERPPAATVTTRRPRAESSAEDAIGEPETLSKVSRQEWPTHPMTFRRRVYSQSRSSSGMKPSASSSTCPLLSSSSHLPPALPVMTASSRGSSVCSSVDSSALLAEQNDMPVLSPTQSQSQCLSSSSVTSTQPDAPVSQSVSCVDILCHPTDGCHSQKNLQDIVDEQVVLGATVHGTSANDLPVAYQPGCDWSHFGGMFIDTIHHADKS